MAAGDAPVRLGMIGCGLISHAHGRAALKSRQNITFAACASRRAAVAAAWAEAYGCAASYTDYRDMLRREALDGVVIATWPRDHRAHVEAALDAGLRRVLCEKALTTSAADALAIWRAAGCAGAVVMEGFMYRHHPAMARMRALVAAGELGPIDNIHGVFHMFDPEDAEPNDKARSWRQKAEAGGGVPHDFICYPVDAANQFAGALPVRVFASGAVSPAFGVINRLYGQIDYANGCVATVASSRKASFCQTFRLAGARATLELPVAWSIPGDITLRKTASPAFLERKITDYPIPQSEPHDGRLVDFPVFKAQLENFAAVIRGRERPAMSLTASVVNAFVLEALVDSFKAGTPVALDLPPEITRA